jgi:hypothetical protein
MTSSYSKIQRPPFGPLLLLLATLLFESFLPGWLEWKKNIKSQSAHQSKHVSFFFQVKRERKKNYIFFFFWFPLPTGRKVICVVKARPPLTHKRVSSCWKMIGLACKRH